MIELKVLNYTKNLDIIVLALTIIFGLFKIKIAFILFLVLTIIILFIVIIYEIIIRKKFKEEQERILKKEVEEIEKLKKIKKEEIQRKKEEEERKRKKKEIIERQSFLNKNDKNINKNKKSTVIKKKEEKIKEILEDMCVLGSIIKEEIIEEKKSNPEKFISIEEATKEENKDKGTFCLGLLAQNLENIGITTAIEKNPSKDIESQNTTNTVLQFITSGMIEKPKFDFHFDFGEERNNELLNNKKEQEKFNNKLKKKLSLEYNIPEDKIIITNPQRGSYRVQVIFQSEEFNKNIDINQFKNKCKSEEFKELKCLKEIYKGLIIEGCKLSEDMLDPRGNRKSGWGKNEKRGGYPYNPPPKGWKGYGLKVKDVYDNGNNDWLAYDGNPNEWAVAYHGIRSNFGPVEQATKNIFIGGFKPGKGQAYSNKNNDNPKYKSDNKNDHSKKIGVGVYCSPNPKVMEEYANYSPNKATIKDTNKKYLVGFMMRVKPDKIRYSNLKKDYWVLDGTKEEMRPYRIMVKEI